MRTLVHLQALRCIAASMVVTTHAIEYMVRRKALGEGSYDQAWLFGWAGVTTFFVISGLIMIRTSWTAFGESGAAPYFTLRRVIRVVPLYWIATALFAATLVARAQPVPLAYAVKSLLFIPYPSEGSLIRPIAGQGWTLDYEMGFYALFAGSLLFFRRLGVAMLLACLGVLVAAGLFLKPIIPYRDAMSPLEFWTDPILLAFAVGVVIGIAEIRAPRWHGIRHPIILTLLIFAAETILCGMIDPGYRLPVFGLGCALAVLVCTTSDEGGTSLAGRILGAGGDASYSTYLFHPFVLMVLVAIWARLPAPLQSPLPFIAVGIVAANVAGYACYRLVEAPLTDYLRRRHSAARRSRVADAGTGAF